MAKLDLNVDAYGSRGQLSLLADFFEFCSGVQSCRVDHRFIFDYLWDRRIRVPMFETALIHDGLSFESKELLDEEKSHDHATSDDRRRSQANSDATRIMGLIRERSQYLHGLYPFAMSDDRVRRVRRSVVPYDVALCLSLRHGCLSDPAVPSEFEEFADACFAARGYRTFPVSARVRSTAGAGVERFRIVYDEFRQHLGLRQNTSARVAEHVHDGGADILFRYEPIDDRPGCRTTLVQATVGKAETWERKLHEPKTRTWAEILGDPIDPLVSLAVPQHVEHHYLDELVKNGKGGTVYDRLRLVAHEPKLTIAQQSSVRALWREGVEL